MEAVVTVDAAQRIVLFNPMAQVLFGYAADDLVGQPVDRLIPLRFRAAHRIWVEQFGRTRSNERRMGSQRQIFALHADGHEFPIEASISHSEGVGTKWYTIMLRDVSERVKANEAQMRLQEELHDLADSTLLAREEDQRAIAGELQQGFGPRLRALHEATAGIAEQMQPAVLTVCWRRLDAIRISLEATDRSIRRICSDLRPQLLDDLGLVPAIQWIATDFEWRYHIAVMVSADTCELDGHSSIGVLRIVQEALTNVARHAQAPQVHMMSTRWAATVRYPWRTTE